MKTQSIKAKGRRLEQLVLDKIIEAFSFTQDDIRKTVGSENGADIKLSAKAKAKFPFSIEIKARKSFDTLYAFYDQAKGHYKDLIPLVIIKGNHKQPLVLLDLDHFLTFITKLENKE